MKVTRIRELQSADLNLAALDLLVGADVDDGEGGGLPIHGEGPNGGPLDPVLGRVPEHEVAQEQRQHVDHPDRQVKAQLHPQVQYLLRQDVDLRTYTNSRSTREIVS